MIIKPERSIKQKEHYCSLLSLVVAFRVFRINQTATTFLLMKNGLVLYMYSKHKLVKKFIPGKSPLTST